MRFSWRSARASIRWRANEPDSKRIDRILDTIRLTPARNAGVSRMFVARRPLAVVTRAA